MKNIVVNPVKYRYNRVITGVNILLMRAMNQISFWKWGNYGTEGINY